MPRGVIRYQLAGDFHFVTFACYCRRSHLGAPTPRNLFERSLETIRKRYEFFVAGDVVMMREHVHLLVSEPRLAILAKVLQALKLSIAVQSRRRPFRQCRYYDYNVYTEAKRVEKLRYMHRNPAPRCLVRRPEDSAWSSLRHCATGERGTVEIESPWTAQRRGGSPPGLVYPNGTLYSHVSEARRGAPNFVERESKMWATRHAYLALRLTHRNRSAS
jgi:putative transposase